jgi:hypothetical protein
MSDTILSPVLAYLAHDEMDAAIRAEDAAVLPGWALFPVRGKVPPAGLAWKSAASADPAVRARLARQHEHDGWAVHAGRSGLFVVDLDEKNGISGVSSWCALLDDAGMPTGEGNPRVVGSTPSGGRHLHYRAPNNAPELLGPVVGILPGVDIRAGESYAVVSGPGRSLTMIDDDREMFPEPPNPLLDALRARLSPRESAYPSPVSPSSPDASWRAMEGACRAVADAPEGSRNDRLNWAANRAGRRAVASGWEASRVADALMLAARDCGLPFPEAEKTVKSGLGYRRTA